jgi:GGDEF domain-containing protein
MRYLTIDGDDIGQKIAAAYLSNSTTELVRVNNMVQESTHLIAEFLRLEGFAIHFCAADGVAASIAYDFDIGQISAEIEKIADSEITFSAGVGNSLREAYIALLFAKSSGKNKFCDFKEID